MISSPSRMSSPGSPPPARTRPIVDIPKASPVYSLRSSSRATNGSAVSLSSLFAGTAISLPKDAIDDIKSVIHHAFVPNIVVHVSDDTNDIVREKGFSDFHQLLRPYGESIQGRITVRDSQGSSMSCEDFGVRFLKQSDLANASTQTYPQNEKITSPTRPASRGGDVGPVEELLDLHLNHAEELVETSVTNEKDGHTGQAFYLLYLRRLLSGLPLTAHESFSHPVACLIAISSRNTAPIETLRKLYKAGTEMDVPGYVNKEYLRYYVLVHDEDRDNISKSTALFEQMKRHFGLHCHLIRLRSATCVESDEDAVAVPACQWLTASEELAEIHKHDEEEDEESTVTRYITTSDESALRTMIREMVAQSVIPFMERNIATWNDQVLSRRKGLSGRVLSFSRRFLGGTTGTATTAATKSNYDPVTASYDPLSPEGQMRKLADFAFMLRDWKLAHNVYDTLRSDFNNDKAWMHLAGAQEMTVISLLLTGQPITHKIRTDIIDSYLDQACYSYITRCSSTYAALRCILVSVELLRLSGGSGAELAAKWATKALDVHLKPNVGRALITQRVGDCYDVKRGAGSGGWGGRRRKAALWHILAAETWIHLGKFAQARHCINLAATMYAETKWKDVSRFVEQLKLDSGFTSLMDLGEDEKPYEEETLQMGRRKSMIALVDPEKVMEEAWDDSQVATS